MENRRSETAGYGLMILRNGSRHRASTSTGVQWPLGGGGVTRRDELVYDKPKYKALDRVVGFDPQLGQGYITPTQRLPTKTITQLV